MASADDGSAVAVKRVHLNLRVEVPAGTDPAYVAGIVNKHLDDEHGELCQWGEWLPGDVTLAPEGDG